MANESKKNIYPRTVNIGLGMTVCEWYFFVGWFAVLWAHKKCVWFSCFIWWNEVREKDWNEEIFYACNHHMTFAWSQNTKKKRKEAKYIHIFSRLLSHYNIWFYNAILRNEITINLHAVSMALTNFRTDEQREKKIQPSYFLYLVAVVRILPLLYTTFFFLRFLLFFATCGTNNSLSIFYFIIFQFLCIAFAKRKVKKIDFFSCLEKKMQVKEINSKLFELTIIFQFSAIFSSFKWAGKCWHS